MRFRLLIVLLLISCDKNEEMSILNTLIEESQNENTSVPDNSLTYNSFVFSYNPNIGGMSIATSMVKGVELRQKMEVEALGNDYTTNYQGFDVGGSQLEGSGDNVSPIFYNGKVLGGRHGYSSQYKDIVGHDKTFADIGSIWTDGNIELVLIRVTGDRIFFTSRGAANIASPSAIYSHVSGATNPSDVDFTNNTGQLLISYGYRTLALEIDGVIQDETVPNNFNPTKYAKITESFIILERASLVESIVNANSPTRSEPFEDFTGTQEVMVTSEYIFNGYGSIVKNYRVEVMSDLTSIRTNISQQEDVLTSTVSDKWYVPKVLDTYEFDLVNLANYESLNDFMIIQKSDCEPTGLLCDLMANIKSGIGVLVHGILPIKDGSIVNRRALLSTTTATMSSSQKQYLWLESRSATLAGHVVEGVGYTAGVQEETERTLHYFIPDFENDEVYMRADWHVSKTDNLPIPTEFQGRTFTIVEKATNVTVSEGVLGATLSVVIDNSRTNGHLLIKIT